MNFCGLNVYSEYFGNGIILNENENVVCVKFENEENNKDFNIKVFLNGKLNFVDETDKLESLNEIKRLISVENKKLDSEYNENLEKIKIKSKKLDFKVNCVNKNKKYNGINLDLKNRMSLDEFIDKYELENEDSEKEYKLKVINVLDDKIVIIDDIELSNDGEILNNNYFYNDNYIFNVDGKGNSVVIKNLIKNKNKKICLVFKIDDMYFDGVKLKLINFDESVRKYKKEVKVNKVKRVKKDKKDEKKLYDEDGNEIKIKKIKLFEELERINNKNGVEEENKEIIEKDIYKIKEFVEKKYEFLFKKIK